MKLIDLFRRRSKTYIFVIGFNKAGTTSLHKLFRSSGLSSLHCKKGELAKGMLENALHGRKILDGFDRKYSVFSDMYFRNQQFFFEGNSLFRQLDKDYPDSLFIYNTRPIENWLRSRKLHKSGGTKESFFDFYKRVIGAESEDQVLEYWRNARLSFEDELFNYFRDSERLLILDIEEISVIEKLNSFLSVEIKDSAWGVVNKSTR